MRKTVIVFIFVLLILTGAAIAECSYFNTNGDHDWVYGRREATCSETGEEYRECSECGAYETVNTLEKAAHTWQTGSTSATCTVPGEAYRDCTVCGLHEVTGTTELAAHTWVDGKTEPTCTAAGEAYRDCSVCGKHVTTETIAATGHIWAEAKVAATCTSEGEVYRNCSVCGEHEVIEKTAMLEHDWQDKELVREADCENDGEKLVVCAVCGETKSLILPAKGHEYSDWEIIEDATCAREGERQSTCYHCNLMIVETIERKPHDYGEWEITVKATDSSMGKRSRQCGICGATSEEWFYPENTLYRGMHKNDAVLEMQEKLIAIGILNDKADGIFGKNTEQAVKDFQTLAGFEVTGIAFPQTLDAIALAYENYDGEAINITEELPSETHCMLEINEDSTISITYCKEHAALIESAAAIYGDSENSEEAIVQVRFLWQSELNRLYETWLESSEDDNIILVEASQTAFIEYLLSQENLWNAVYADESLIPEVLAVETLMKQCAEICNMIGIAE